MSSTVSIFVFFVTISILKMNVCNKENLFDMA